MRPTGTAETPGSWCSIGAAGPGRASGRASGRPGRASGTPAGTPAGRPPGRMPGRPPGRTGIRREQSSSSSARRGPGSSVLTQPS